MLVRAATPGRDGSADARLSRIAFRLAPPTHDMTRWVGCSSWTCGTGRHRVTEQRYALAIHRVKPAPDPARVSLWMTACRGPSAACYVRRHRGSPPPSIQSRSAGRVTPATSANRPLTCKNVRSRSLGRVSDRLSPQRESRVHNLWTKVWTQLGRPSTARRGRPARPDRTARHSMEKAGARGADTPRTSTSPGAAWSTTSSPTSAPGCARASRSPCTRAPRSSRCPTTSPATSSRAGCAPSSRTR